MLWLCMQVRSLSTQSCDQIFDKPMHPYTDGLMKCIPKLDDDDTKELSVIEGHGAKL